MIEYVNVEMWMKLNNKFYFTLGYMIHLGNN